jgi:hypothetical protein
MTLTWGAMRSAAMHSIRIAASTRARFHTILLGSRRYRGMDTAGKMQECFNNEAFCKKRAAAATDATARAVFAECARCWRELADCWRELTSKTAQRVDKLRQDKRWGRPIGGTRQKRG